MALKISPSPEGNRSQKGAGGGEVRLALLSSECEIVFAAKKQE